MLQAAGAPAALPERQRKHSTMKMWLMHWPVQGFYEQGFHSLATG